MHKLLLKIKDTNYLFRIILLLYYFVLVYLYVLFASFLSFLALHSTVNPGPVRERSGEYLRSVFAPEPFQRSIETGDAHNNNVVVLVTGHGCTRFDLCNLIRFPFLHAQVLMPELLHDVRLKHGRNAPLIFQDFHVSVPVKKCSFEFINL